MAKKNKVPLTEEQIESLGKPLGKILPLEEENDLTNKMIAWFRKVKSEGNTPKEALEVSDAYYKKHKKPIWL